MGVSTAQRVSRWAAHLAIGLLGGFGLAACAPALDWREVAVPQAGLVAWFPCRPALQVRASTSDGAMGPAGLMGCDADGKSFVLVWRDTGDPRLLSPTLRSWRESTRDRLGWRLLEPMAGSWTAKGMTPNPEAGLWRGRTGDGVSADRAGSLALFSRGTVVVQATVVGPPGDATDVTPFFEGFRFQP